MHIFKMDSFQLIKQGAEAKIYQGTYLGQPTVAKERFSKKYRHEKLDTNITKERMKAEGRAIVRCKAAGVCTPALYLIDFERNIIFMEFVENAITVKQYIDENKDELKLRALANAIGINLAKMHANNIIHGDLTTSNMLFLKDDNDCKKVNLMLIDFGLAHVESSAEDKAVDLYVLERALLSTHDVAELLFAFILEVYKKQYKRGNQEVMIKYEEVRARGRKRTMVG